MSDRIGSAPRAADARLMISFIFCWSGEFLKGPCAARGLPSLETAYEPFAVMSPLLVTMSKPVGNTFSPFMFVSFRDGGAGEN